MSFSFFSLILRNISVVGSFIGGIAATEEMLEFCTKHQIKVMVEDFTFEEFPKALDRLENGRPVFRCVVNVKDYATKHNL